WDDIAYDYELKDDKVGLEDLISDVTELRIPLPKVGVLTIFGKPEINLRINGAVDIHAAWRNETTEGLTVSRLGNTRNEPDFKQQVQINVNGTIGDKLEINADWNTERTFEYENQLKIAYTGYEDEIVQSVEAGNVSLALPSLIGGSEALFGVKAKLQFGPLFLTALVSQKKGEVKEKSVSGGVQTQEFEIHAYDYSKSHYFIDEVYTDTSESLNLFQKYYGYYMLGLTSRNYDPEYEVLEIEVWKSVNQILTDKSKEREAIAHIDLEPYTEQGFTYGSDVRNADQSSGEVESGRFMLLEPGIDYDFEPRVGLISFRSQINDNEIIAVAYRVGSGSSSRYYGEMLSGSGAADDTTGKLVLKLVKPQNLGPSYEKAWNLQARNFYFLGSSNIKRDGFELDIQYVVDGGEPQSVFRGVNLLNAFALDRENESGNVTPDGDGKFDWKIGATILPATGEIVFPVLQPFGAQMPSEIADTSTLYQDVYEKTVTEAKRNTEKDKFLIKGVVSGEASSKYMLGFNIVENSVKVLLDGNELSEGADYSMDYTMGQLTIYNSAALAPGADLRISYEENDLVQLASKTLYGARGELELAEKTSFGFSAMTVTHKTLSDKVRLGEEPLSNSIYGVDFGTEIDLPFLTNAVDYLFPTKQASLFSLSGEAAYIDPDPNTQKSEIASDNGQSIAYVDDFEGAK
ncbi:MAG: cell surface protein SprA, partial [Ignavibacteriales bacterium]|nr:cell surface protein SprA [Ignavibacteriales bacterium]